MGSPIPVLVTPDPRLLEEARDAVEEAAEACEVGRCKLDPGLKAPPGFKILILKRITVLST